MVDWTLLLRLCHFPKMCSNKNHKAFKEVPREKSTRRWARSTNFREMRKKKNGMLTKETNGSFHHAAYRGETEWDSTDALKNTGRYQFIQRQESRRSKELAERANEKQWGSLYANKDIHHTGACHPLISAILWRHGIQGIRDQVQKPHREMLKSKQFMVGKQVFSDLQTVGFVR